MWLEVACMQSQVLLASEVSQLHAHYRWLLLLFYFPDVLRISLVAHHKQEHARMVFLGNGCHSPVDTF